MGFVAVFADCRHNGVLKPYLHQLTANMHKTTLKKKHESSWLMVLISLNVNHYPGCSYASFLQNNAKKYSKLWKKNIALATWKTAFSKVMCLRRALLSPRNILRSRFLCRHTTLLPTRLRRRLHSGFIAYSHYWHQVTHRQATDYQPSSQHPLFLTLATRLRSTKIHHFHIDHNAPCLPSRILHNHCFQFLLRNTVVPREIEDNCYARFFFFW